MMLQNVFSVRLNAGLRQMIGMASNPAATEIRNRMVLRR